MSAIDTIPWMARKNPPETGKKIAIAARVDPALLEWLEGVALEQERSLSFMVERAIRVMREQMELDAAKRGSNRRG